MPVGYLSNFPALLGEKDVLKSLQLYPGTGSSLESSGDLLIRGGGQIRTCTSSMEYRFIIPVTCSGFSPSSTEMR